MMREFYKDPEFQSALPLRGATQAGGVHARALRISIRAPLAGSDCTRPIRARNTFQFQSALPLRGATKGCPAHSAHHGFQSALPLRGATRLRMHQLLTSVISIRAPLAGSDVNGNGLVIVLSAISIRAPLAGSDFKRLLAELLLKISIRAPLAGSDMFSPYGFRALEFQSALPLRGATAASDLAYIQAIFQSALPLRGATINPVYELVRREFQSALPLRGATATFCSINLLSAKCCIFKDRHRKFSRQTPQNNSKKRHNEVRTSLVEHERL